MVDLAEAVRVQIAQHQKLEALAIHLLHLHHKEIMAGMDRLQQAPEIETAVVAEELLQLVQLLTHRLAETEALEQHHQLLARL
jgi:hypothetical protein